jgi:hypothetical protein
LAEAGGGITLRKGDLLGNVGRLVRLGVYPRRKEVIVQQRRMRRHGLLDIDDMRQDLVFDLDQVECFGGDCW